MNKSVLVSPKLVDLVEKNTDQLSRRWMELVREHPDTPTYHTYDRDALYERALDLYGQLGKWLAVTTTKKDIRKIFTELGSRRRKEGFALSEVLQALIIARRVLWMKIESEGLLKTDLDFHLALQVSNRTILFFDRAMLFAAQGYEAG